MLSHLVEPESEGANAPEAPAADDPKRGRLVEFFSQFDRGFFRSWLIEGPLRTLEGRFSHRAAGFMIAGAMPAILGALFLTVPGFLFQTPQHHAFFYFAKIVEGDSVSTLPMLLGAISSLFCFRFPLGG